MAAHTGTALTVRQGEILLTLRRLKERNGGNSPTLRELASACGVISTQAVREHLDVLEGKGYIRRPVPGASRGIVLTEAGFGYGANAA